MAQLYQAGAEVEYFSGSMNQWIPARILRRGQVPGTYDLDCKDNVGMDRIRQPAALSGELSFGQPSRPSGGAKFGAGPLGLRDGEACFYKSSTHGWITAQMVRFRPDDGSYDLDVKAQVQPQNIFRVREGETVEYHSASSDSWIPARVLRCGAEMGVFDLDCKDGAPISRIRPPKDSPGGGGGGFGGGATASGGYGGGGGRLAPLPESGVYGNGDFGGPDEGLRQQKLDQLRQAVRFDQEAIRQRLESQSAPTALQGEEDLAQASHKLWSLEARPAAQAELKRAIASGNQVAIEAALEAAAVAGVPREEIEAARQSIQRMSVSPVWMYDPGDGHHIDVRAGPDIDGKRVKVKFHPGDLFCASEERRGPNGITYLQLADGRGWLFDKKPGVGVMCKPHVVREADTPGIYKVIHDKAAITPTEDLGADDDIVGKLAYGAIVKIVQVENKMSCGRIRGRLENPSGWISLRDTDTGKRWAVKQAGGDRRRDC